MHRRRSLTWLAGLAWSFSSSTYLGVGLLVFGWSPLFVILALWFSTVLGLGVCLLRMLISQSTEPEEPASALVEAYEEMGPTRALFVGIAFLVGHVIFLGILVMQQKDELMLALLLSPFIQMPSSLVEPVSRLHRPEPPHHFLWGDRRCRIGGPLLPRGGDRDLESHLRRAKLRAIASRSEGVMTFARQALLSRKGAQ